MARPAQTIAEMAIDTRLLVGLLSKADMGQQFSYEMLSQQLGRPIKGSCPNLMSARRIVQRDFDMVFDTIHNQGIKRLNDAEIVALGDRLPGRIRRMARRSIKVVTKARDEHLSNEQIVQRNATVSMAGVLVHMASRGAVERLESAVRVNAGELPVGKTLELFKA